MCVGDGIQETGMFGNMPLDQDLDRNREIVRILGKTEHKGMYTSPLLVGEDKWLIRKDQHIWGFLILKGRQSWSRSFLRHKKENSVAQKSQK